MINYIKEQIRPRLPLIGYLILSVSLFGAIYFIQQGRSEARKNNRVILTRLCERTNELSDIQVEEIYQGQRDLTRTLKLLKIPDTEELRTLARDNANRKIRALSHQDCTVFPPDPPKRLEYPLIKKGKPVPTLPF